MERPYLTDNMVAALTPPSDSLRCSSLFSIASGRLLHRGRGVNRFLSPWGTTRHRRAFKLLAGVPSRQTRRSAINTMQASCVPRRLHVLRCAWAVIPHSRAASTIRGVMVGENKNQKSNRFAWHSVALATGH